MRQQAPSDDNPHASTLAPWVGPSARSRANLPTSPPDTKVGCLYSLRVIEVFATGVHVSSSEPTQPVSALVARSRQARAKAQQLCKQADQLWTTLEGTLATSRLDSLSTQPESPPAQTGRAAHPAGRSPRSMQPFRVERFRRLGCCIDEANQTIHALQRIALLYIADGGPEPVEVARATLVDAALAAGPVRRALYDQSTRSEGQPPAIGSCEDRPHSGQRPPLDRIVQLSVSLTKRRALIRELTASRAHLVAGVTAQREALQAITEGRGDAPTLAQAGLDSALSQWNDITEAGHRRLRDGAEAM